MPRGSTAYHHGHLREAVLTAAARLVDDGELLGLREIGRRVGVSHTAVHHHFPTVETLAVELAAIWFGDLDRAMAAAADAIPPGKPLERFRALGAGYVRYALEHPHRYRLQFRGGETGLPRAADASFHRVLETVVACGARHRDPMTTTILAWSTMHGLASLWIDGAFRKRLDRRAMDALIHTITGLVAELLRA
jgi:AcrR family transcriptional regulator